MYECNDSRLIQIDYECRFFSNYFLQISYTLSDDTWNMFHLIFVDSYNQNNILYYINVIIRKHIILF